MEAQQPTPDPVDGLRETLDEQRITAHDQIAAAWQLHITRLEEQIATGWKEHVEHVIEERFRETTVRVEEAFARQMETRVAELRQRLRRDLAERLNQLLRTIRRSESDAELYAAVLEASGAFAQRSALLVAEGQMLRCEGSRDFTSGSSGQLTGAMIPLTSASAMVSAIESKDTVLAARSSGELSEQVAGFLGEDQESKAGVFPICVRGKVAALLCASAKEGEPDVAGLELLTMLAGLVLESRAVPAPVTTAEQPPAPAQVIRITAFDQDLSAVPEADRALHLRAQRYARARVAEMRLYKASQVRAGRAQSDLYSQLKDEIDAAREGFQREFLSGCESMVDYLHLELVRTLANGDAALLGQSYPGPLG